MFSFILWHANRVLRTCYKYNICMVKWTMDVCLVSRQIVRKLFSICTACTRDVCSPFRTPFGISCSHRALYGACGDWSRGVPSTGWSCRHLPSTAVSMSRDSWLLEHPSWSEDFVASRSPLETFQRLARSKGSLPCQNGTVLVSATEREEMGKHGRWCSHRRLSLFRWSRSLLLRHCSLLR